MPHVIHDTLKGARIGATAGVASVTATFALSVAASIYKAATDECPNESCNVWPLITFQLLIGAAFTWEYALGFGAVVGGGVGGAIGFTTGCARDIYSFFKKNEQRDELRPHESAVQQQPL